jgi:hypothetical protein
MFQRSVEELGETVMIDGGGPVVRPEHQLARNLDPELLHQRFASQVAQHGHRLNHFSTFSL